MFLSWVRLACFIILSDTSSGLLPTAASRVSYILLQIRPNMAYISGIIILKMLMLKLLVEDGSNQSMDDTSAHLTGCWLF